MSPDETCACFCDCANLLTETVERMYALCTACEDDDHYFEEMP